MVSYIPCGLCFEFLVPSLSSSIHEVRSMNLKYQVLDLTDGFGSRRSLGKFGWYLDFKNGMLFGDSYDLNISTAPVSPLWK